MGRGSQSLQARYTIQIYIPLISPGDCYLFNSCKLDISYVPKGKTWYIFCSIVIGNPVTNPNIVRFFDPYELMNMGRQ